LRNSWLSRRNRRSKKRKIVSRPLWRGCWQIRGSNREKKRKRGNSLGLRANFDVRKFDSPSSERS